MTMMVDSQVEFLRADGSDLDVVNAARVSFGKEKATLDEKDERLIHFLARGMTQKEYDNLICDIVEASEESNYVEVQRLISHYRSTPIHWEPFAHVGASFRLTIPIFVARQLVKHRVGMVWSEVSRRYVSDEPDFYDFTWRQRADNVKQGSGPVSNSQEIHGSTYDSFLRNSIESYYDLLDNDIAPEQARGVLPQSTMTTVIATATLVTWIRVIKLRTDPHAQSEISDVASEIGHYIEQEFPVSYEALMRY